MQEPVCRLHSREPKAVVSFHLLQVKGGLAHFPEFYSERILHDSYISIIVLRWRRITTTTTTTSDGRLVILLFKEGVKHHNIVFNCCKRSGCLSKLSHFLLHLWIQPLIVICVLIVLTVFVFVFVFVENWGNNS